MKWGVELCKKIIVYPCGDIGIEFITIMKSVYGIEPAFIIDNQKCKYSENIHNIDFLQGIDTTEYILVLASINLDVYRELYETALKYITDEKIIQLGSMKSYETDCYPNWETKIGKYSYGPICRSHIWIESIGSFCSFAEGTDVVGNHEFRYITTHPMIYEGKNIEGLEYPYDLHENSTWFFAGVEPKVDKIRKQRRAVIGNDVWLGKNVTVTNSANIGNGVIAAAGAVITKDVPDYAIVAGVPARVIRYRYESEQIEMLNKISMG